LVRAKICGLTRGADVAAAVMYGADAVGFISGFPSSPRNVSLDVAAQLAASVPPFVSTVLVTSTAAVSANRDGVRATRIPTLQLHGEKAEAQRLGRELGVRIIRPYSLLSYEPGAAKSAADGFDALLTDTFREGFDGGTGLVSDWAGCRRIRDAIAPVPMVLSGGLNPDNISEAVKAVRPYAVDVSSGVESAPGIKDHAKIADFIGRAKEAVLR
jgi:phosphoribosylanthranilate isomerase